MQFNVCCCIVQLLTSRQSKPTAECGTTHGPYRIDNVEPLMARIVKFTYPMFGDPTVLTDLEFTCLQTWLRHAFVKTKYRFCFFFLFFFSPLLSKRAGVASRQTAQLCPNILLPLTTVWIVSSVCSNLPPVHVIEDNLRVCPFPCISLQIWTCQNFGCR